MTNPGKTCCVHGCHMKKHRDRAKSFFRVPSATPRVQFIKKLGIVKAKKMTKERRKLWISSIGGENWTPSRSSRVCSEHFVGGKPAPLDEPSHADWVPTVQMGHNVALDKLKSGHIMECRILVKRLEQDIVEQIVQRKLNLDAVKTNECIFVENDNSLEGSVSVDLFTNDPICLEIKSKAGNFVTDLKVEDCENTDVKCEVAENYSCGINDCDNIDANVKCEESDSYSNDYDGRNSSINFSDLKLEFKIEYEQHAGDLSFLNRYPADVCSKSSRSSLVSQENVDSDYQCSVCNLVFNCGPELREHRKISHQIAQTVHEFYPQIPRICFFCSNLAKRNDFSTLSFYQQNRLYECRFCPDMFSSLKAFGQHIDHKHVIACHDGAMEVSRRVATVVCFRCQRFFPAQGQKRPHSIIHVRMYTCLQCDTQSQHIEYIEKHPEFHALLGSNNSFILDDNRFKPKLFRCNMCRFVMSSVTEFQKHLCFHINAPQIICHASLQNSSSSDVCNSNIIPSFQCDLNFDIDSITSSGQVTNANIQEVSIPSTNLSNENDFYSEFLKCAACFKIFPTERWLLRHIQIHRKPGFPLSKHVCSMSSYCFWEHFPGGRLNKCLMCSEPVEVITSTRKNFEHQGVFTLPCHICGMLFKKNNVSLLHSLSHRSDVLSKCHICGKHLVSEYEEHAKSHGIGARFNMSRKDLIECSAMVLQDHPYASSCCSTPN